MEGNQKVEKLVMNLDNQSADILLRLETLQNLAHELSELRLEMDDFNQDQGMLKLHHEKVHKKIKLFDDLLNYSINHLEDNYMVLNQTQNKLHQKVIKQNY